MRRAPSALVRLLTPIRIPTFRICVRLLSRFQQSPNFRLKLLQIERLGHVRRETSLQRAFDVLLHPEARERDGGALENSRAAATKSMPVPSGRPRSQRRISNFSFFTAASAEATVLSADLIVSARKKPRKSAGRILVIFDKKDPGPFGDHAPAALRPPSDRSCGRQLEG